MNPGQWQIDPVTGKLKLGAAAGKPVIAATGSEPCCCGGTGACCHSDGSCTVLSEAACEAAGGIYRGDGVSCIDAQCPSQPCTPCQWVRFEFSLPSDLCRNTYYEPIYGLPETPPTCVCRESTRYHWSSYQWTSLYSEPYCGASRTITAPPAPATWRWHRQLVNGGCECTGGSELYESSYESFVVQTRPGGVYVEVSTDQAPMPRIVGHAPWGIAPNRTINVNLFFPPGISLYNPYWGIIGNCKIVCGPAIAAPPLGCEEGCDPGCTIDGQPMPREMIATISVHRCPASLEIFGHLGGTHTITRTGVGCDYTKRSAWVMHDRDGAIWDCARPGINTSNGEIQVSLAEDGGSAVLTAMTPGGSGGGSYFPLTRIAPFVWHGVDNFGTFNERCPRPFTPPGYYTPFLYGAFSITVRKKPFVQAPPSLPPGSLP